MRGLLRDARVAVAGLSGLRPGRVPDAPAMSVRDPWPGDADRGALILRGELRACGGARLLRPGEWGEAGGSPVTLAAAHGFTWLRDLRALGTDAARARARLLVADWIAAPGHDPVAARPDVAGARLAAWLGHYDFFADSADDGFRHTLMARLVAETRLLAARLPAEPHDARGLTALKGLVAAAVALPDRVSLLARALRLLGAEIGRQVLPDGCHAERSPAAQLAALADLVEVRALLQAAQVAPSLALATAIERLAPALRVLRHGDGGLALFNGSREGDPALIDLVLAAAGRGGRAPAGLVDGGFHRLQAGRAVLLVDCGTPAAPGLDRAAHAGTAAFEFSVGRERLVTNLGARPAAGQAWRDALRATAAHSTLAIDGDSSAELLPDGLGRRAGTVEVHRQEAGGAHWLELAHDGYAATHGAVHRRRLYLAESGEDLRGEDTVEASTPLAYAVRFHLHPNVAVTAGDDPNTVILRLPLGGTWRLRTEGAPARIEDGVYLGGDEPRPAQQVVLPVEPDGPRDVKWAITRVA